MTTDLRAWAEIDLDAIGHNTSEIKKKLSKGTYLMGVVKANAYGHGVRQTAKVLLENGADQLAVAFTDEAVELRKAGFDVPILVLGNSPDSDIKKLIDFNIMPTVSDYSFAERLSRACNGNKTVKVHIKLDTGMSRIGFLAEDMDTVDEILKISNLPHIQIEGMFSHFAVADDDADDFTRMQFDRFMAVAKGLEEKGLKIPFKHICNSAGLLKFPEMHLDMVRAGIILYGIYPSADFDKSMIDLKPSMAFKSRVSHIKVLDKGASLGYGRTYTLNQSAKIATVSVGYADGYMRSLSNKAVVYVDGCEVKQTGRICMDQCMIDVTAVNNINVGDEVILFGGSGKISAENTAELIDTIGYELVCAVGRRVPRIYIRDGEVTEVTKYLLDT
jgi:alanine racemase